MGITMNNEIKSYFKLGVLVLVVLLGLSAFFGAFYTVDSGERAIVKTFGSVSSVSEDGLHLKIPFIQSIVKVDIRTKKAHSPASAGTKDMQTVDAEVALNYHLDDKKLDVIYSKFGMDLEDRIIEPRIQEVVKAVVAKYSADQLLSQRELVKNEVARQLKSSISQYSIIVEDIQITNFKFSASFNAAIESKQTAEQSALKAKNDLDRIKVEAEQKIATAQAEAEAIKIQASAIKEQGGSAYIALKFVEKWDGQLPTYTGASSPIPFMNMNP
jgi:regulator of protease activity HflC (stomatin/prohibitin superfamily)